MKTPFYPFPILSTPRLILRQMMADDVMDLFSMRSDPRMNSYTDSVEDRTLADTGAYIDKMNCGIAGGRWIVWAMEDLESHKVVGSISLWNLNDEDHSGELGYGIHPDFQRRGLMKEALRAVVEYGWRVMGLRKIEAYTEIDNAPSNGLLERCGFHWVQTIEEAGVRKPQVFVMKVYRITSDDGMPDHSS